MWILCNITMENYEEKYKEALERARTWKEKSGMPKNKQSILDDIFPELKESEDERIRKELLDYLDERRVIEMPTDTSVKEEWISWLEKQGEQKQHLELKAGHWYLCHQAYCERADILTVKEGEMFKCEKDGIVKGLIIKEPEKYFREISTPSDKVEPKFKVGDWIVEQREDEQNYVWHIDRIENEYYYENVGGIKINFADKYCHLWTISDVKDGDILEFADHGRIVIGIVIHVNKVTRKVDVNCLLEGNNFKLGNYYAFDTINPHPATKEQRDILFQKIEKARYKWDVNKKELIRYEQ